LAGGNFGGGTGTELDPYLVEDAADLNAVRNNLTAAYKQTANIDLISYTSWEPIGLPFSGRYDQNGYYIDNLQINSDFTYHGLFGVLANAVINNIDVRNASIINTGGPTVYVGILAAIMSNVTMLRGKVQGEASCTESTNGMVGGLCASIENSSVIDQVEVDVTLTGNVIGGFATFIGSTCTTTNCSAKGRAIPLDDSVYSEHGGFVFQNYPESTLDNCYAAVSLEATFEFAYRGGFACANYPTWLEPDPANSNINITSCYFDTDIAGIVSGSIATPKTAAQMKQQATFVGWDFVDIWSINEGVTYPYITPPEPPIVLTSPVLLTDKIYSANPLVTFKINKQENIPYLGPKLHCRIETFADAAMTQLLDDRTSNIVDSSHPSFEYSFNGATWFDVAPTGIDPTQYGNFDMYVRARVFVGPRQQAYVRCSIGIDD